MRQLSCLIALTVSCMLPIAAFAASCETDSVVITKEANSMKSAFEKGDAKTIVDLTDPSLIKFAGGKEKLLAMTQTGMAEMTKDHMAIEKYTLGTPSQTYQAGAKSVCFIPTELVLSLDGKRARSKGYLVAINSNDGRSPWRFLDSAGFREKPDMLWELVPELPKDVKLPPNFAENVD